MRPDTLLLHGAADRDEATGGLSVPIYPASTYYQKNINKRQPYDYSRSGNPTRQAAEELVAVLEKGARGYAFTSGMAAITAGLTAFLKAGDHVVACKDIYGGSFRLITNYLARFNISHTFVDTTDPAAVEAAIRPETKVLYLESPSNPLLRVTDLVAMATIAKKHRLVSLIDNTFQSPYFCNPIVHGIDVVIHSGTKFLAGHSDLLCGAIVTATEELGKEVYYVQNATGGVLSPQDSWLLIRGIKTLGIRMRQLSESAMAMALWLKKQTWVKAVYYPGLPEHPGHAVFAKQNSGFGAVVSFEVDSKERAVAILRNARYCATAVSLGGVETIISYPWKMSHSAIPVDERLALGIGPDLLRLSVGLEDVVDLQEDLSAAAAYLDTHSL